MITDSYSSIGTSVSQKLDFFSIFCFPDLNRLFALFFYQFAFIVTGHAVNIVMIYQTSCIDLSCSLSDQLSIFDNFLSFLQICQ